jgi:hypothetical protein
MNPPAPTAPEGTWIIPGKWLHLADGTWWLKPCRPVQRCSATQTAKITGVSRKILANLAEAGLIRRAMISPVVYHYYLADVEAFINATVEDPTYWTPERLKAYLGASRLRRRK